MRPISEKWELYIGKEKHIISGKEKDAILQASAQGLKFVAFRDLIINPAFVIEMVLIETDAPRLTPPKQYIENDRGEFIEV